MHDTLSQWITQKYPSSILRDLPKLSQNGSSGHSRVLGGAGVWQRPLKEHLEEQGHAIGHQYTKKENWKKRKRGEVEIAVSYLK